jgi:hypothetical protein
MDQREYYIKRLNMLWVHDHIHREPVLFIPEHFCFQLLLPSRCTTIPISHPSLWGGVSWITQPIWMNTVNHTDDHSLIICAAQMWVRFWFKQGVRLHAVRGTEPVRWNWFPFPDGEKKPRQSSRLTFWEQVDVDLLWHSTNSVQILSPSYFCATTLY